MIKQVIVCDGCGKELSDKKDIYYLNLRTDKFWNAVEMDRKYIDLMFCEDCARKIKTTLQKIAEKK